MADEQYRWLDRETAERLLRGESLEAVDPADRDQAERLAKTLEALTAEPLLSSAELPGEAAALAAFRAARGDRDDAAVTVGGDAGPRATRVADVGLVRIGGPARAADRPRWGRPVRLGLAAALAVGMVGGVAVAAGTGVLTTPFVGDEGGRPAASVSAPAPPERPLLSPSPERGVQGGPTPDDAETPAGPGATEETAPGGRATDPGPTAGDGDGRSGDWWKAVTSYCRDLRDGKQLSHDRRRALERAAGGSERVRQYCKTVLQAPGGTWDKPGRDKSKDKDKSKDTGRDRDRDRGTGGDRERGDEGDDRRVDAAAVAPSAAVADFLADRVLTPLAHR
ncbi:hypothetical protein [Streptomyces viridochromogenes]|uniref:hypothetical protein n=1 Tax=Streptomyces viridochromogenes TaxID=1938 RepID=UPI00069D1774|nr:hypothetical protein [Streptomyces viridochromogenes]